MTRLDPSQTTNAWRSFIVFLYLPHLSKDVGGLKQKYTPFSCKLYRALSQGVICLAWSATFRKHFLTGQNSPQPIRIFYFYYLEQNGEGLKNFAKNL